MSLYLPPPAVQKAKSMVPDHFEAVVPDHFEAVVPDHFEAVLVVPDSKGNQKMYVS